MGRGVNNSIVSTDPVNDFVDLQRRRVRRDCASVAANVSVVSFQERLSFHEAWMLLRNARQPNARQSITKTRSSIVRDAPDCSTGRQRDSNLNSLCGNHFTLVSWDVKNVLRLKLYVGRLGLDDLV